MESEMISRNEALTATVQKSFAKSAEFLESFDKDISSYNIDELKDIRKRISTGLAVNRLKSNLHSWQLGQPVSPKIHEQLCDNYASVKSAEYDIVETENKAGEITQRYQWTQGLKFCKPNTEETVLRMMKISGIDKPLQSKYMQATTARKNAQQEYAAAIEAGTDTEVGKAQRSILSTTSNLTTVKREITKSSAVIENGKEFASSLLAGVIAVTRAKKAHRMSQIKIMGAQTDRIQKQIQTMTAQTHNKVLGKIGSMYHFTPPAKQLPEIEE